MMTTKKTRREFTDEFKRGGPVATDPKLHFNSRTVTVCCREIDA